jgi:hypothetical protein
MFGVDELTGKTSGGSFTVSPDRSLPSHIGLAPRGRISDGGERLLLTPSSRMARLLRP